MHRRQRKPSPVMTQPEPTPRHRPRTRIEMHPLIRRPQRRILQRLHRPHLLRQINVVVSPRRQRMTDRTVIVVQIVQITPPHRIPPVETRRQRPVRLSVRVRVMPQGQQIRRQRIHVRSRQLAPSQQIPERRIETLQRRPVPAPVKRRSILHPPQGLRHHRPLHRMHHPRPRRRVMH